MAYWLNDKFWMCDRHNPASRISAEAAKCWNGCGTVRPPKPEVFRVQPVKAVPAPPPHKPVKAAKVIRVKSAPVVRVKPVMASAGGPTELERRRGATQRVECPVCQKVLWRRPKEVTPGTVFFCSPAHRVSHRKSQQ